MIGIVVAHADDESFGMGGTIAKLAKDDEIALLILADGVSSRETATAQEKAARSQAASAAAEVLGITRLELLGLPDQRLDHQVSLLDIVQFIEHWLNRVLPATLYTHFHGDLNLDHRLTAQAVLTATRPTPGQTVRELYSFEVPSSTEWAFGQCGPAFQPNVFEDVTDTFDVKLAALGCYDAELRKWPHPRSALAIAVRAEHWGSVIGCNRAEAFQLIRSSR